MGTIVKKGPAKSAAKKKAAVKKAVVKPVVAAGASISKHEKVIVVKAKKAATAIVKKEYTEPAARSRALSNRPVNKIKALSKEDLKKRQQKKTTNRKQGGVRFEQLQAEQTRTLANLPQSAPTDVE